MRKHAFQGTSAPNYVPTHLKQAVVISFMNRHNKLNSRDGTHQDTHLDSVVEGLAEEEAEKGGKGEDLGISDPCILSSISSSLIPQ